MPLQRHGAKLSGVFPACLCVCVHVKEGRHDYGNKSAPLYKKDKGIPGMSVKIYNTHLVQGQIIDHVVPKYSWLIWQKKVNINFRNVSIANKTGAFLLWKCVLFGCFSQILSILNQILCFFILAFDSKQDLFTFCMGFGKRRPMSITDHIVDIEPGAQTDYSQGTKTQEWALTETH